MRPFLSDIGQRWAATISKVQRQQAEPVLLVSEVVLELLVSMVEVIAHGVRGLAPLSCSAFHCNSQSWNFNIGCLEPPWALRRHEPDDRPIEPMPQPATNVEYVLAMEEVIGLGEHPLQLFAGVCQSFLADIHQCLGKSAQPHGIDNHVVRFRRAWVVGAVSLNGLGVLQVIPHGFHHGRHQRFGSGPKVQKRV